MSSRARILLWSPVALLLAYEFYLSAQSTLPSLPGLDFPNVDKLQHTAYFFLTASFATRAARFGEGWSPARTRITLIAAALIYGTLDEFHQSFVPERAVQLGDVAADVFGAVLATLLAEPIWKAFRLDRTIR
ncbi:MAG: VanZ family protein [Thermoanaerobaculia bacterium]